MKNDRCCRNTTGAPNIQWLSSFILIFVTFKSLPADHEGLKQPTPSLQRRLSGLCLLCTTFLFLTALPDKSVQRWVHFIEAVRKPGHNNWYVSGQTLTPLCAFRHTGEAGDECEDNTCCLLAAMFKKLSPSAAISASKISSVSLEAVIFLLEIKRERWEESRCS